MKPGRNPWSFFMQKNNENLGKTLTYGAPYVIIYTCGNYDMHDIRSIL